MAEENGGSALDRVFSLSLDSEEPLEDDHAAVEDSLYEGGSAAGEDALPPFPLSLDDAQAGAQRGSGQPESAPQQTLSDLLPSQKQDLFNFLQLDASILLRKAYPVEMLKTVSKGGIGTVFRALKVEAKQIGEAATSDFERLWYAFRRGVNGIRGELVRANGEVTVDWDDRIAPELKSIENKCKESHELGKKEMLDKSLPKEEAERNHRVRWAALENIMENCLKAVASHFFKNDVVALSRTLYAARLRREVEKRVQHLQTNSAQLQAALQRAQILKQQRERRTPSAAAHSQPSPAGAGHLVVSSTPSASVPSTMPPPQVPSSFALPSVAPLAASAAKPAKAVSGEKRKREESKDSDSDDDNVALVASVKKKKVSDTGGKAKLQPSKIKKAEKTDGEKKGSTKPAMVKKEAGEDKVKQEKTANGMSASNKEDSDDEDNQSLAALQSPPTKKKKKKKPAPSKSDSSAVKQENTGSEVTPAASKPKPKPKPKASSSISDSKGTNDDSDEEPLVAGGAASAAKPAGGKKTSGTVKKKKKTGDGSEASEKKAKDDGEDAPLSSKSEEKKVKKKKKPASTAKPEDKAGASNTASGATPAPAAAVPAVKKSAPSTTAAANGSSGVAATSDGDKPKPPKKKKKVTKPAVKSGGISGVTVEAVPAHHAQPAHEVAMTGEEEIHIPPRVDPPRPQEAGEWKLCNYSAIDRVIDRYAKEQGISIIASDVSTFIAKAVELRMYDLLEASLKKALHRSLGQGLIVGMTHRVLKGIKAKALSNPSRDVKEIEQEEKARLDTYYQGAEEKDKKESKAKKKDGMSVEQVNNVNEYIGTELGGFRRKKKKSIRVPLPSALSSEPQPMKVEKADGAEVAPAAAVAAEGEGATQGEKRKRDEEEVQEGRMREEAKNPTVLLCDVLHVLEQEGAACHQNTIYSHVAMMGRVGMRKIL
uniref:Transcription initiation factor TFIID component TAF4 C-terminal domain-containing protein n=1 Tax=Palpitomonas bilix TaxID=652834 RepID=A0A7S3G8M4_9EUKA|mmetsp:Transcript_30711/g.80268  ORF Transcript_30711/g.80268 Transcript_30711/m.80268 type:complete len:937 (+) Transcript_30711:342-3152(+)